MHPDLQAFFPAGWAPPPPAGPMRMAKKHIRKIPLTSKGTAQIFGTTTATLICFPREVCAPSAHTAHGTA